MPAKKTVKKSVKATAKKETVEKPEEKSIRRTPAKRSRYAKTKTVKDDIEIIIPDDIKRGKKSLVIVESPAKARTISKYLGKEFYVEASVGHIKNLPSSKIGVDVENNYQPEYRIIDGKQDVIRKLKTLAASTRKVYIATDPDREGEAIAWHIAQEIEPHNDDVHRVLFNEITKSGVSEAMTHPSKLDMKLVQSQQARRVMDRIVGYKVSPFLWTVIKRGTSAGRVQSVALRLVCERDALIDAFVPQEYWSIRAKLQKTNSEMFIALLQSVDGKKPSLDSEQTTKTFVDDILNKSFIVSDIRKRESKRNPAPPFITSSMQQEASRKCGFSPKMTMAVAQQLYEGVDTGADGLTGLITYMRTDSTRVADSALQMVREYIYTAYGRDYLPETPNEFKSQKTNTQDAHEAIRPTSMKYTPREAAKFLTPQQARLYELIWNRFVASQMAPALIDQTAIDISAEEYLFRATGSVITFRGFLQVYEEGWDEGDKKETNGNGNGNGEESETSLPANLRVNDRLNLIELLPAQHFTKPPARFTESSLIKELDNLGIGRPSTYAMMVGTIVGREYAEIRERKLFSTPLGQSVNQILSNYFPNLFNVQFTAEMEEELDKIEEGKLGYKKVLDDFYNPFSATMADVESRKTEVRESLQEETGESCELCAKPMIIRWGRYGRFMACTGYPECKNVKRINKEGESVEPEATSEICPKCSSPMVIKEGRFGRFMACSNYPDCKTTKPILDIVPDVLCSKDGGQIVRRKSRYGKYFYGCANYPQCDFVMWSEPVNQPCDSCGAKFLAKKSTKKKGDFLLCVSCNAETKIAQDNRAIEPPNAEPVTLNDEDM